MTSGGCGAIITTVVSWRPLPASVHDYAGATGARGRVVTKHGEWYTKNTAVKTVAALCDADWRHVSVCSVLCMHLSLLSDRRLPDPHWQSTALLDV